MENEYMSKSELKEYAIELLTKLLINIDIKEKETNSVIYVRKKDCYADLIKFIKEF